MCSSWWRVESYWGLRDFSVFGRLEVVVFNYWRFGGFFSEFRGM